MPTIINDYSQYLSNIKKSFQGIPTNWMSVPNSLRNDISTNEYQYKKQYGMEPITKHTKKTFVNTSQTTKTKNKKIKTFQDEYTYKPIQKVAWKPYNSNVDLSRTVFKQDVEKPLEPYGVYKEPKWYVEDGATEGTNKLTGDIVVNINGKPNEAKPIIEFDPETAEKYRPENHQFDLVNIEDIGHKRAIIEAISNEELGKIFDSKTIRSMIRRGKPDEEIMEKVEEEFMDKPRTKAEQDKLLKVRSIGKKLDKGNYTNETLHEKELYNTERFVKASQDMLKNVRNEREYHKEHDELYDKYKKMTKSDENDTKEDREKKEEGIEELGERMHEIENEIYELLKEREEINKELATVDKNSKRYKQLRKELEWLEQQQKDLEKNKALLYRPELKRAFERQKQVMHREEEEKQKRIEEEEIKKQKQAELDAMDEVERRQNEVKGLDIDDGLKNMYANGNIELKYTTKGYIHTDTYKSPEFKEGTLMHDAWYNDITETNVDNVYKVMKENDNFKSFINSFSDLIKKSIKTTELNKVTVINTDYNTKVSNNMVKAYYLYTMANDENMDNGKFKEIVLNTKLSKITGDRKKALLTTIGKIKGWNGLKPEESIKAEAERNAHEETKEATHTESEKKDLLNRYKNFILAETKRDVRKIISAMNSEFGANLDTNMYNSPDEAANRYAIFKYDNLYTRKK